MTTFRSGFPSARPASQGRRTCKSELFMICCSYECGSGFPGPHKLVRLACKSVAVFLGVGRSSFLFPLPLLTAEMLLGRYEDIVAMFSFHVYLSAIFCMFWPRGIKSDFNCPTTTNQPLKRFADFTYQMHKH